MAQLNQIKGMSRIKVIEIGDQISAIYDFSDLNNNPKRLGGGGGNGEHIFFPLAKKLKPDAILYMTDGYCTSARDPDIPTGFYSYPETVSNRIHGVKLSAFYHTNGIILWGRLRPHIFSVIYTLRTYNGKI